MKANEFVKKFGWSKAKEVASFTSNVCVDPTHFDSDLDIYVHFDDFKGVMDESDVCITDLKRLVKSHELVALFDDIECAKAWVCDLDADWPYQVKGADTKFFKWQLEYAIADVESCL